MSDRLRVSVEADVTDFSRGMDRAADSLDEVDARVRKAKSRWESVGDSLKAISPTFSKISDEWKKVSEDLDSRIGKNTKSAKGLGAAAVAVLAVVAAKVAGIAARFADETARMFDPVSYSKAQGKLDKSVKRLKTTIGALTAGLVNGVKKALAWIIDYLTRCFEELNKQVSIWVGFLQGILDPVVDAFQKAWETIKNGINAIAGMMGMGDVFKDVSESAGDAADSMGEVVEATSAGLASFDKLSTLDFSNMGDTEQADKIKEASKKYNEAGRALAEKVKETIGKIGDWFNGLKNIDLTEIWTRFESGAADAWRNVKAWGEGVWNDLTESVGRIWDGLTDKWEEIKTKVVGYFDGLIDSINLGEIWESLKKGFDKVWSDLWNSLPPWVKKLLEYLGVNGSSSSGKNGGDGGGGGGSGKDIKPSDDKTLGETILGGESFDVSVNRGNTNIANTGSNVLNNVISGVQDFADDVGKTMSDVGNSIKNFGESIFNGAKNLLGFASGGVVKPNDPFLALVGDNRTEAEVISPVSTMKSAFKEALSEMRTVGTGGGGSSGGGTRVAQNITLSIDGKQLARLTFDDFVAEARRRGMRVGQ